MEDLGFLATEGTKQLVEQAVVLLALISARVIPLVQLVPYLGGKATPQVVKMGLALAIALLVWPAMWSSGAAGQLPTNALEIAVLLGKEVMIGMTLGFVAALVFESVNIAGQVIDNARGQTMATSMVPELPSRVSVSSSFLFQFAIVVFFLIGGHRLFLGALVYSFQTLPPHALPALEGDWFAVAMIITRLTADAIAVGVLLGFPVLASILLTDIFLGLVNKAAPQINVFFLGMPLKAMLGVAVLLVGLDILVEIFVIEAGENIATLNGLIEIFGASAP